MFDSQPHRRRSGSIITISRLSSPDPEHRHHLRLHNIQLFRDTHDNNQQRQRRLRVPKIDRLYSQTLPLPGTLPDNADQPHVTRKSESKKSTLRAFSLPMPHCEFPIRACCASLLLDSAVSHVEPIGFLRSRVSVTCVRLREDPEDLVVSTW